MGKILYSGKAKEIIEYKGDKNLLIQRFKNSVTAGNNQKRAEINGKGQVCNEISSLIYEKLNKKGFKTHFIKKLDEDSQLIKRVKIVPLEIIVRNFVAGSFAKRWKKTLGEELPTPIVEFSYKNDDLQDPFISEEEIIKVLEIDKKTIKKIKKTALKLNSYLKKLFLKGEILLYDFKIEVGFDNNGNLLLADEISPDTCRLRSRDNVNKVLDKDLFRLDLGDLLQGYKQVLKRIE
jgi:phosphoribosylaminoimidazole-succinocarboxamide synthase